MGELELIFCKKELKYMFKLVEAVEKDVKVTTAATFALVFNTLYWLFQCLSPKSMLLILWPSHLSNKNNFAENHVNFIKLTFEWYSLSLDPLFCLIGDNCSTNKATADLCGMPLLGCRSHRFNLAVEAYISTFLAIELDLIGKLMSKLSTLRQVECTC